MGFDLSGVDAELAALGAEPPDVEAFSRAQAGALGALPDVDSALAALEAGLDLPLRARDMRVLPLNVNVSSSHPGSGEITLGEPVHRHVEPASFELSLFDSDRPSSGSYELPADTSTDDLEVDPFASAERAPDSVVASIPLNLRDDESKTELELSPIALDPSRNQARHSAPLLFVEEQQEPDTNTMLQSERDADAEFDALFDEATHPSGIPTRGFDADDDLNADDLLSGLGALEGHESDEAMDALLSGLEVAENTEVIDTNAMADLDPFPLEEELGSSEFEIVLDDDGAAKDLVPSQPPADSHGTAGPDKRPSFLGRLFGRKDDKP